jgi:hypothetical protein
MKHIFDLPSFLHHTTMTAVATQQSKDPSCSPTTTTTRLMTEEEEGLGDATTTSMMDCPQRRRSFTRTDLELFNLLEHPVYVFDIDRKAMWWANKAAMILWNADTLQSLLARDFAHDMSEATSKRLTDCLRRLQIGEKFSEVVRCRGCCFFLKFKKYTIHSISLFLSFLPFSFTLHKQLPCLRYNNRLIQQWTFYPNGGGPVTTYLTTTGIWVDDEEEHDGNSSSSSLFSSSSSGSSRDGGRL